MLEEEKPYSNEQSLARFAAVCIIEIFAFLLIFIPVTGKSQWEEDCRKIQLFTVVVILFFFLVIFLYNALLPRENKKEKIRRITEIGILGVYFFNIICLSFIVVRTGGPVISLYAPLIPIQLSAILFLQIDQDRNLKKISKNIFIYAGLAIAALLFTHFVPQIFATIAKFNLENKSKFLNINSLWNIGITISGIILALLTYWLRLSDRISSWLSRYRWYPG